LAERLTDDKFAIISRERIKISDMKGLLLQSLPTGDACCETVSTLSDSLLLASLQSDNERSGNGVQIWNMSTGALVKYIPNCEFVGTCSLGFFTRPNHVNDVNFLHAYDCQANFIGLITTDAISTSRVKKVAQLASDLYAFEFYNDFKIIKCNFKLKKN
jgi:WD40 repeat protein